MKSIFFDPCTLALAFGVVLAPAGLQAEDTNTPAGPAASRTQDIPADLMRSFLYLQEQMHATQMAVERSRLDAEAAAARNSEALNARLRTLEEALVQTHTQSSTAVEAAGRQISESNRQMMLFAGIFASIGFLALAANAWLQWRMASRLTPQGTVGYPALMATPGYAPMGLRTNNGQSTSIRLMHTLGRLEHRIAELELGHHAARTSTSAPITQGTAPASTPAAPGAIPAAAAGETASSDQIAALIKEGEELLAHEEAEKAILHFDGILAKHPGHPEVLLHKGAALERLERDEEALECYDQALRTDQNLTMAYLHKGGLYNRMEKFSEAMECYEKALKVQEGRAPET